MTDRPIIRLRREAQSGQRFKGRKPKFPRKFPPDEQGARFSSAFSRLDQDVAKLRGGIGVSSDPSAVSPERALVFEVIGSVEPFANAAQQVGFEWLGEALLSQPESDADEDETIGVQRLYLTIPTVEGLEKLLRYWRRYQNKEPASSEEGLSPWWALFGYLADLRVWSAEDRIDSATVAYIQNRLQLAESRIAFEIDLWFRGAAERRSQAYLTFARMVQELGGEILDHQEIEAIEYDSALVSLPAFVAQELVDRAGPVAMADMIMSVRPQATFITDDEKDADDEIDLPRAEPTYLERPEPEKDNREAIVALLDGYPISGHALLRDRIEVEEVDIEGKDVPVSRRHHGTAMASLILHGDLSAEEPSLTRTLKVVPILGAPQGTSIEAMPNDKLPVAMIYRAVVSLMEGIDERGALAPNVVLLNHSVCNSQGPFVRKPSAWARLLDYLSYHYRILFLVSAGNIDHSFKLPEYADRRSFEQHDPIPRQISIIRALSAASGKRGILSPAESVNALTVGAVHADAAGDCPPGHVDPFLNIGMTGLYSATGFGFNRSIKPDFIMHGGRQVAQTAKSGAHLSVWGKSIVHLGQMVAAPGEKDGDLNATFRCCGTSNATALATRAGVLVANAVEEVFRDGGADWSQALTRAVVVKALLAHGCNWNDIGLVLDGIHPDDTHWRKRRVATTRFLGYGQPNLSKVLSGDTHRVTLLGDDKILADELHEYRLPIPDALQGNRELRRITVTLAWTTPVRGSIAPYRGVVLDVKASGGNRKFWRGVDTTLGPPSDFGPRGTLIHFVLEGENRAVLDDPDGMYIAVQSRAVHSDFAKVPVPYAIAMTLELAETARGDIYADVRTQIDARIKARDRLRNRI